MMPSLLSCCITLLLAICAHGAKPLGKQVCVASCYYALLQGKFAGPNPESQKVCNNTLRVRSTFYCAALHCPESDLQAGIRWWAGTCKNASRAVTLDAYRAAVGQGALADHVVARMPLVPTNPTGVLNGTVLPSAENWKVVYRSVKTFSDMRSYHNSVRWVPYGFWAIVLLVGIAGRLWSFKKSRAPQAPSATSGQTTRTPGTLSSLAKFLKFDLELAPTFSHRHHEPWGWLTVPLRLQSIVIVSYIIVNVAVCAANYPIYDENYYYKTRKVQALRYLGDRVACLMQASLPLLFLFGARSNPLQMATGWSYRTFSLFHRWIGVIMLVAAFIHGMVLAGFDVAYKGWDYYREQLREDEVYHYGILAITSMGFAIALAIRSFRARFYEIFKTTHIVFAAIALAATYEHVKTIFQGLYRRFVWVCVGIWAADYVIRFLRIIWMNLVRRKTVDAVATFSEETSIIRLRVETPSSPSRQTPGQYYFLSFAGVHIWQSHPFTVAARSKGMANTANLEAGSEKNSTKRATQTQAPASPDLESLSDKPYMTFLIRPKNGMTRRVRDVISQNGGSASRKLKVLLEGPYGTGAKIEHYRDILFIAGGSGISAVLPYVRMLLEDDLDRKHRPKARLVWANPQAEFMRQVVEEELCCLNGTCSVENLTLDLYMTSSVTDEKRPRNFQCKYARPDIDALVKQFVQQTAGGETAVFVCGPGTMADEARAAVIRYGKAESSRVDLIEEMFEW